MARQSTQHYRMGNLRYHWYRGYASTGAVPLGWSRAVYDRYQDLKAGLLLVATRCLPEGRIRRHKDSLKTSVKTCGIAPRDLIDSGQLSKSSWRSRCHIAVSDLKVRSKVRMTGAPSYISQHLVQHVATRQTRSTALPLLTIPRTNTEFARRSYSYSAPFIWNSLPGDVLHCNSEHTFKKHLKTCLFNSCFYAA